MIRFAAKIRRFAIIRTGAAALLLAAAVLFNALCVFAESSSDEFYVQIECDGKRSLFLTEAGTVKKILKDAGIKIGKYDIITPSPGIYINDKDDTIAVTRRELVKRVEKEIIPFETVEIPTSILKDGVRKTLVSGREGLNVTTYLQMHEEGKPIEEEENKGKKVVTKPVNARVFVGKHGAVVSPFDFDVELNENGLPENYASVITGQRAAGYSAGPNAGTASGRPAAVGNVAVNPSVIPYGTRLYICSEDASFVYGCAIAADTGTALKNGIIDVDLFFATYDESAMYGIRNVNIYILE